MEDRIVRFIAALRASGVRVSVAESQDAWQAVEQLGITDRDTFRLSLRTTLVKDADSIPTFEELFPKYFGTFTPPLIDPQAELSPEQQQMLQELLQEMLDQLANDLQQLLEWLLSGRNPTQEELEAMAEQVGLDQIDPRSPYQARRAARRMQNLLNWEQLEELLDQLWEMLAERGMDPETIEQLKQQVAGNEERLQQQLNQFAGQRLEDNRVDEAQKHKPLQDLMNRPFNSLSASEMDLLREQVRRLAARLRTRAALRQKRGKQGKLDPKATIRANLRYSGVPFEMRFKQRRLKPKLVVILDVSTSMRPVAEFFLRMLYELQDQVQKTRSFAFIDHLEDVTPDLTGSHIDEAVYVVLTKLPAGYYNTDLGFSLHQFEDNFLDTVDHRTTMIVLGDGRNNYNDPALDVFNRLSRRSRKLIWMNPEYPAQWGTGDSDMLVYAPLCSELYQVRNLAQLADAIDHILM
ncbi:MAG TPA: VWA domain-containing protein [Aggregatilineaceae bacterium]|nr:VWA domain-containing protein [Aggregatilineaceae bacterium]